MPPAATPFHLAATPFDPAATSFHLARQLAMLEVSARAERLDYTNAQLAAARAELRALDNQLVIVSNQLATTQQATTPCFDLPGSRPSAADIP